MDVSIALDWSGSVQRIDFLIGITTDYGNFTKISRACNTNRGNTHDCWLGAPPNIFAEKGVTDYSVTMIRSVFVSSPTATVNK